MLKIFQAMTTPLTRMFIAILTLITFTDNFPKNEIIFLVCVTTNYGIIFLEKKEDKR